MDDPRFGQYAYYERLVLQIKQQVVQGILQPGDKLPSVRDMAKQVQLNPNTVAKAYKQLEADGTVAVRPGKGSFITAPSAPDSTTIAALHRRFAAVVLAAKAAGVTTATLQQWAEEHDQEG